MRALIVSVDGPGSSGKSSVGAEAARRLGYRFCDTGVLYRGLTWLAVHAGVAATDVDGLVALIPRMHLAADAEGRYVHLIADGADVTDQLHTADVERLVSEVSRNAPVRAALLPVQRRLAEPGGMIMAGRDIGTVVLPDADLKIYLQVSVEERARRRAQQRGAHGDDLTRQRIEDELRRRDGVDAGRETAPLRVPDDAVIINTDHNTLEQTVEQVVELIRRSALALGRAG